MSLKELEDQLLKLDPKQIEKIGHVLSGVLTSTVAHYVVRKLLRQQGFSKKEARVATNALSSAAWLVGYNFTTAQTYSRKASALQG